MTKLSQLKIDPEFQNQIKSTLRRLRKPTNWK